MNRSERRKIALFWPTLSGGGVERNGLRIAKGLCAKGYSVDIVVANARGELGREIPPGIRLIDLRCPLGKGRLFLSVRALARYLKEHSPDILMANMTESNLIAILARRMAGSRCWLIVSEHNLLSRRVRRAYRKRMLPLVVRHLYPLADAIHAVSQAVADDLASATGISRDRIRVIHNPVVSSDLFVQAEEPVDHPWFRSGEPPVIIGVGRLTFEKDFPTLLRAFALVRRRRAARLMILGEGEERGKLEAIARELRIEPDIALPGFVENPYKYMKRARVFVHSSRWEGFGNVLVEAMALGVPVVSTECPGGPTEILEGGKWGDLVPVGDVGALASAIVERLERTDSARLSGAAERARAFSVEAIVSDYCRFLFPQ